MAAKPPGIVSLAARVQANAVLPAGGERAVVRAVPVGLAAICFAVLFYQPFLMLVRDWWLLPEAGHGLLLAPVAGWLAFRAGRQPDASGQIGLGVCLLLLSVLLRYAAGLAAEYYTMRLSILGALLALTVYYFGTSQVRHWWLSFLLLFFAIPLPELVTQALALPLQFKASQLGARLLELRHVPVHLSGNVIRVPGHDLFVTEACSGLRSLTALLSTALLTGAVILRTPFARVLLLLLAIPVAVVINGVRVFVTGFLVYFVSPAFGTGFMHQTEGWLLFLVSLAAIGGLSAIGVLAERRFSGTRRHA